VIRLPRRAKPAVAALFVLGMVCALLASVSPARANPGTSVSVALSGQCVEPQAAFNIQIVIDTDVVTRGMQVGLDFDPAVVQYLGFIEGNFYSDWAASQGCSTFVLAPVENPPGLLDPPFGVSLVGSCTTGGPTGSGSVVTFQFSALQVGVSPMDQVNVSVVDELGGVIPGVVLNDSTVEVSSTSVGGVAEYTDAAQSSLDVSAAENSSSSTSIYAILAGGVAVTLVVLGIGGWYATRRRAR
jgi:hypothetical protein